MKTNEKWDVYKKAIIFDALNEMFSNSENTYSLSEYSKLKSVKVVDRTMIVMIESKSERAKDILYDYVENMSFELPKFEGDYSVSTGDVCKSKFSMNFVNEALDILKASDDECGVWFSVKKDYPLTLENRDFRIIIAPRIEN